MRAAAFSPRKASMTFYLGDQFQGAKTFSTKLGKRQTSVACVYLNVNRLDDIALSVLREIIKRDFKGVGIGTGESERRS